MKKKMKYPNHDFILNSIFGIIIAFVFLAFLLLIPHYSAKDYVDATCYELTDNWYYLDSDNIPHPVLKGKVDVEDGEFVFFQNVLPQVKDGYCVAFYCSRDISIYIDGELRGEFSLDSKPLSGGSVKNQYLFVDLYANDSGKELLVEKHSANRFNGYLSTTYIGTSWGIVQNRLKYYGNIFVLNLFFLILSLLCIIGGLLYRIIKKKSLNITQLVLALFLVGGWLTFDSDVFQFIFGIRYLDGIMSYIFALLVPFPIMRYINSITGNRYRRHFLWLGMLTIVELIIFSFLNFSGISYFGGNIAIIDTLIAISCGLSLLILVYDFCVKGNREYKYFMLGIVVFSALGAAEMISINIVANRSDGYFVVFGLYFLIAMAIIQQIIELSRMEVDKAKALEANESKSRFLASMSHELRTPINSIIGMDELIIRDCQEPKVLEYASYIKSASNNLLGIVNDILDFSKIEAGKMDVIEADYQLADVINELSVLLKERAVDKGLQYKINISPDLPRGLHGDALHVKQVVINLISNAIKYTKSGTVSFYMSMEESDINNICVLKIVVSDTGIGIKEENISKLFDYYSRLDSVKNHTIEGTGLGLNIVKQLLDTMNGTIKVESDYGFGSTFTVFIPQSVVDKEPIGNIEKIRKSEVKNSYKESFRAQDANILLVDDNNINLLIVKKLLENTLINVDAVESGHEALRLASNMKYDLLLLDHMMPQMDGIELLHKIKKDEKALSKDTPAIVLTANAVSGMREMYLSEGFVDYISKPIEPSLLEEIIAKWLPKEKVIKDFD